jgi:hypothetical protein
MASSRKLLGAYRNHAAAAAAARYLCSFWCQAQPLQHLTSRTRSFLLLPCLVPCLNTATEGSSKEHS